MAAFTNYLFLALKNIKRRKMRSWLTLLGIFIGIAAVISLISLGQGLQNAVMGQFSSLGTDRLIFSNAETGFGPPGSTAIKKINDHDLDIIKSVSGVDKVIPRLLRPAKIEFNKLSIFNYLISMPSDSETVDLIYETMNLGVESGSLLTAEDRGVVLLGHDYTKENTFDKEILTGNKLIIQGKSFEVKGILKPASTFEINSIILMNEEDMQEILDIEDEWDLVAITVEEGADPELVAEEIKQELRKDRKQDVGEEDFSVQTPVQALQSVNTILNIINLIVAGIAAVSLLVGGIGIANTMYTSVLERRKEIGVMKSIGARNSDVLMIFLLESALLGFIGGLIGILLGLALAFGLSSAANKALETTLLSVRVSWPLIISAMIFSLVIGILSGVLPARQASKLKPVDAFRS